MYEIDINTLTERQREVLGLIGSGMSQSEVAKKLGCTCQNVYCILKAIKNKEAKKEAKKTVTSRRGKYKFNLDEIDLTMLSPREKEVVILRSKGMAYAQIAEELNISTGSVGVMLRIAREKISGEKTYWQKNREKINASYRKSQP